MSDEKDEIASVKTLGMHLRKAWRESNRSRPFSFYLLLAIIGVLVLGLQIVHLRDDPRQFAFVLSLLFIFFFAVMVRAIVDFAEITKRHMSEREKVYRTTLGDDEFVSELGRRVSENRKEL
jgi:hypothetical protein